MRAAESVWFSRELTANTATPSRKSSDVTTPLTPLDTPTSATTPTSHTSCTTLATESTSVGSGASSSVSMMDSVGAAVSRGKRRGAISYVGDGSGSGAEETRAQKQRDVLCMERCLLEQWFCDGFTVPLPIKVLLMLGVNATLLYHL